MAKRVVPKRLVILAILSFFLFVGFYLYLRVGGSQVIVTPAKYSAPGGSDTVSHPPVASESGSPSLVCQSVERVEADIETSRVFPTLEVEPDWMERREFWGSDMEDRFQRRKPLWNMLPLRVIVMPHSHTDPGWLKTVEGYYATSTKAIITNMVQRLTELRNMTFILTEISYLKMWWDDARPQLRDKMRKLVEEGRLEIPTGGWVMTDEANVDLYSMIDQLVEGHSFLRKFLGYVPKSSWSVDSFGHGGTFPHLLHKAGIDNMVIMRIHFAWKEWFARYQQGNFFWKQSWEEDGSSAPLCLQFPYDIYSIKHSCGPHPQTCLGFDFRHVDGEYNEFTAHYTPIDSSNIANRAELLLEQYGRTGSLFPHNVVLVPLGDDFRYNREEEFDQQYSNYIKIMEHINNNPDYHAKVTFGTLSDYFNEVRTRMSKFPTLTGDFFVYSDIFSEGRPAYWSGYYSTRPFAKLLGRRLADKLRSVEILYSIGLNIAKNSKQFEIPAKVIESHSDQLEEARRSLGLFQHHDAITGTSKSYVMEDYVGKLMRSIKAVDILTETCSQFLLQPNNFEVEAGLALRHVNWLSEDGFLHENTLDLLNTQEHTLVALNSLAHERDQALNVKANSPSVCIKDSQGENIDVQVTPVYNITGQSHLDLGIFDIWFMAHLQPLSLNTFSLYYCDRSGSELDGSKSKVFCLRCPKSKDDSKPFSLNSVPDGGVQLENKVYKLKFDPVSYMMESILNKLSGKEVSVKMNIAAYPSSPFRSGGYLFAVERNNKGEVETVPVFTERDLEDVVIVSGVVFVQLLLVWKVRGEGGDSLFASKIRLYHSAGPIGEGVFIENMVDFGTPPNMRDREVYMRFSSSIDNGENRKFFTDQSGLNMMRREWVEKVGLEGNYFPITESTYLQDGDNRLTLLVNHASGAASPCQGCLEVMFDRRTVYDDARGMGEGILDSRQTLHSYWLLLEPKDPASPSGQSLDRLSPLASVLSRQLNNHATILHSVQTQGISSGFSVLEQPLPCDIQLLSLRSWVTFKDSGSSPALMILHRDSVDCSWASLSLQHCHTPDYGFTVKVNNISAAFQPVSLTANFNVTKDSQNLFKLSPMEIASFNVTFS